MLIRAGQRRAAKLQQNFFTSVVRCWASPSIQSWSGGFQKVAGVCMHLCPLGPSLQSSKPPNLSLIHNLSSYGSHYCQDGKLANSWWQLVLHIKQRMCVAKHQWQSLLWWVDELHNEIVPPILTNNNERELTVPQWPRPQITITESSALALAFLHLLCESRPSWPHHQSKTVSSQEHRNDAEAVKLSWTLHQHIHWPQQSQYWIQKSIWNFCTGKEKQHWSNVTECDVIIFQ